MSHSPCHLVIGAGITGLTVALHLQEQSPIPVLLVEKSDQVGGLAAGRIMDRRVLDPGSHRIHPGISPPLLQFLRNLPGVELDEHPRHGRLYLQGRWLSYPPSTSGLLTAFGPLETMRFIRDFLISRCRSLLPGRLPRNYEAVCIRRMGNALYRRFYRPYARRLFAHDPRFLDASPASGRLRSLALQTLWREFRQPADHRFLYPRQGFHSISRGLLRRLQDGGGRLLCNTEVLSCHRDPSGLIERILLATPGGRREVSPVTVTATVPPPEISPWLFGNPGLTGEFSWRDLRIIHLLVDRMEPDDVETFYFPEPVIPAGRVSRIDRYSPGLAEPDERILLTCEIPCTPGDTLATLPPGQLAFTLRRDLQRLGITTAPPEARFIADRHLSRVYPLHTLGWRSRLLRWLDHCARVPNLGLAGRSGLFLHCNLDHCLLMAQARVESIIRNEPAEAWRKRLEDFLDFRIRE